MGPVRLCTFLTHLSMKSARKHRCDLMRSGGMKNSCSGSCTVLGITVKSKPSLGLNSKDMNLVEESGWEDGCWLSSQGCF